MLKVNYSINQPFTKAPGALLGPGLHPPAEREEERFGGVEANPLVCTRTAQVQGGEQHCWRMTMKTLLLCSNKAGCGADKGRGPEEADPTK